MRYLAALLIIIPGLAIGQEVGNFKIEQNQLVWQKVYEAEPDKTFILSLLQDIQVSEEATISGKIRQTNFTPYLKKIGKRWGNTSPYLFNGQFDGNIVCEIKDGKYRITLTNIYHHYDGGTYDFSGYENDMAINNKGQFRRSWVNNISDPLDKCFEDLFTIKETKSLNEDW